MALVLNTGLMLAIGGGSAVGPMLPDPELGRWYNTMRMLEPIGVILARIQLAFDPLIQHSASDGGLHFASFLHTAVRYAVLSLHFCLVGVGNVSNGAIQYVCLSCVYTTCAGLWHNYYAASCGGLSVGEDDDDSANNLMCNPQANSVVLEQLYFVMGFWYLAFTVRILHARFNETKTAAPTRSANEAPSAEGQGEITTTQKDIIYFVNKL